MRDVAYAYAETFSKTPYSGSPVTYYILSFDLLSAIHAGIGQIATLDRKELQASITEQMKRGVRIVTNELPRSLKPEETKVFKEDITEPLEVKVKRVQLDKAA